MIARSLPLAFCLLWLAYQSQFSASVFTQTVATGLTSIAQGIESALEAETPAFRRVASVNK